MYELTDRVQQNLILIRNDHLIQTKMTQPVSEGPRWRKVGRGAELSSAPFPPTCLSPSFYLLVHILDPASLFPEECHPSLAPHVKPSFRGPSVQRGPFAVTLGVSSCSVILIPFLTPPLMGSTQALTGRPPSFS